MVNDKITVEISSSSPLATVISLFCVMTIGINLVVCYQIYRRRSLRSSCTALIVANLAVVDMLVSIKDLPMLFAVSMSGRWYFEEHWCRSYGLTNVIYIIVSISTLVTITTEQYLRITERPKDASQNTQNNRTNRSVLLGYIIAHTTLSYSLSLLWSKYVFISRKAFCQVDWPPSGLSFTIVASCVFLVPVSLLVYNLFNSDDENQNSEKQIKLTAEEKEREKLDTDSQTRLQLAIGLFLLTWCPYVIESFFSVSDDVVPNVIGLVCAFIPICTTTLIPLWYLKWKRQAEERAARSQIFILQC
ncbi:melanopsin [Exaiptasia diaphana]|uniref:G-protein coupled receptors family 1 profile domain-containing protein n=1 Tax=Exaiptasia diaphana TaxID=2652724 RepID=A0A913YAY4_EXADI|nr:melanopsin [Exaiptasia diaphana]KXJ19458.1 Melanopsin [Exaiptasia diaphana]